MSKYGNPEIYSRFLRKDWLKVNNTRIHFKAFIPSNFNNNNKQRLEISCFETQNLNTEQIKNIFMRNNILLNSKYPVGHCSINEDEFPFSKLDLDRNYFPERHVDIIGWEYYSRKEDRNEIASMLAEIASHTIAIY